MANLPENPKLSAQNLLLAHNSTLKHGALRMKRHGFQVGKWSLRFLVILRHSMYVYKDERSSGPIQVIRFHDYCQVVPEDFTGNGWCFTLVAPPDTECKCGEGIRNETFSCASEEDRKSWVAAILTQIALIRDDLGLEEAVVQNNNDHTYEKMGFEQSPVRKKSGDSAGEAFFPTSYVRRESGGTRCANQLLEVAKCLSKTMVYLATENYDSLYDFPKEATGDKCPLPHLASPELAGDGKSEVSSSKVNTITVPTCKDVPSSYDNGLPNHYSTAKSFEEKSESETNPSSSHVSDSKPLKNQSSEPTHPPTTAEADPVRESKTSDLISGPKCYSIHHRDPQSPKSKGDSPLTKIESRERVYMNQNPESYQNWAPRLIVDNTAECYVIMKKPGIQDGDGIIEESGTPSDDSYINCQEFSKIP